MTDRRRGLVVAGAVLCAAVLGPPPAADARPPKADEKKGDPIRIYELGVQFLNQARPDRAAQELEKAVKLDPSSPVMNYALGLAYLGMRDWKRAEKSFNDVLELDPYFTDAHNNLGIVYSEIEDPARARAEWERCLADTKYRTPEVARFNIGKSLLQQGKAAEALPYLKAAVDSRPTDAEWQLRQGLALQALERRPEAAAAYEAALKIKPSFVDALFQLALVSLELKNEARARECLGRVTELAPGTPMAVRAAELLKGLGPAASLGS